MANKEEGERPHIRIPYKTDKDKEQANRILDELTSWAFQDGKIVEVGVHPDFPIALGLALERAEMWKLEPEFGVLEI